MRFGLQHAYSKEYVQLLIWIYLSPYFTEQSFTAGIAVSLWKFNLPALDKRLKYLPVVLCRVAQAQVGFCICVDFRVYLSLDFDWAIPTDEFCCISDCIFRVSVVGM